MTPWVCLAPTVHRFGDLLGFLQIGLDQLQPGIVE
jgi:hypothetical protein